MIVRRLPLLLLLCLSQPLAAGEFDLQAPDEITGLLAPYLPDEVGSPGKLQGLLSEILATEGYFSPVFEFAEQGDGLKLTLDPGRRTTIHSLDLRIDGPVEAGARQELIDGWALPVGQPFRQDDWNTAKQQILSRLLAVEHADARLLDSEASIDTAAHRADLRAHYEAGPRYRFGPLRVEGLQNYSPDLIARYNRIVQPGQPYREDKLNALQTTLQSTPYFASVQTLLDREAAEMDADGNATAPVLVRVRERSPHRVSFGAGASSNTGARVEFNYHTPNLFGQAWELDTGLRLEQKRQTAYADVFLPPDERNRRHSVGVMAEATDIQNLKTERYAFGAQTIQQRGSVEQRLSLNWQNEQREPDGASPVTSRALVPNGMWTWRHVDSLIEPRNGTVLQGQIGGGSKAALSDQNFVRFHARFQHFIPLGRVDTLTLRGEIGYTLADSRQRIPQDYLFRTGGAGSVRGYAYQSLGIKEGNATVGGRYLGIASAELTHWLDEDWGFAAFIDAGDAVDSLQDIRLAIGYGLGARWRSPAGPIGVDLAYGERTRQVQLHFSLAIPF
ncbi:autotransporter assembly complex protein TamA [Ferribacterium limneticum]|uniref:autotransporter assembly complex protein TamA n=1 Tax=Ferribacterium limneticum TaxID=76259 RepID=UPI001CF9ED4A|nr:autotransporter assembly complex family protein [Ferribacterium limneticum]UCV29001.1 outer membrane protein assembly factor [Ferribacterium limneticum]UCV32919.1 outer membrane protein assembly factor [Ferribacterium limneticum]